MNEPERPSARAIGVIVSGLFASTVVLAAAAPARAASVLPLNLEELAGHGDRVFVGRVIAVVRASDSQHGFPVRYTTFDVLRKIKGPLADRLTIKQVASGIAGQRSIVPGAGRFRRGDEMLVFLYPDSSLGFTSPVGLFQGQLPIVTDPAGKKLVVGEFTPGRLLNGLRGDWVAHAVLSKASRPRGIPASCRAIEYGDLMTVLERIVRQR
jgi:hypothetical protein